MTSAFRKLCQGIFKQATNSSQSCAYEQQRTRVHLISVEICTDKPASKTIGLVQNRDTSPPAESHQAHREQELFLSMVPIWNKITVDFFIYYTISSRPLLSPQALLLCLECVLIAVFLFLAEPLIFLLPLWTAVCQCTGMFLQRPPLQ